MGSSATHSTLDDLRPGQRARLVALDGQRSLRRRLMELGLLPGTVLRLVRRVAVGDLVEVEARGTLVSLRRAEARRLTVEPIT
jgi:ferrous iron transport protein A